LTALDYGAQESFCILPLLTFCGALPFQEVTDIAYALTFAISKIGFIAFQSVVSFAVCQRS
jgi:hypothetical protein